MKEVVDGLSQDIQIFKSETCMNPWSEETAYVSGIYYLFQNGSKKTQSMFNQLVDIVQAPDNNIGQP